MSDDDTPHFATPVHGAGVGITVFDVTADPVIVLTYHLEGEVTIHLSMTADELEATIPPIIGAVIRARVLTEMITLYPERRDEIIQNILFRWTDGEMGESDGS